MIKITLITTKCGEAAMIPPIAGPHRSITYVANTMIIADSTPGKAYEKKVILLSSEKVFTSL